VNTPVDRTGENAPAAIVARLERMTLRSMSALFLGILGLGFFFNFYDIFDINVSFIQTCSQILPGCTPKNAAESLGLPTLISLVGYVVGALLVAPLSDRIGRRRIMLVTMVITGAGALYTLLCNDYSNFVTARGLTGIGIGADLAVVNTYIGEVAPRHSRAKYTSATFIMSTLGATVAIWLGLLLTTEASPWPRGLPFALSSPGFESGWRWMYGIAVAIGATSFALRFRLPESPRWLIGKGRIEEADAVVSAIEARAQRRGPLPEPVLDTQAQIEPQHKTPYRELLGDPRYLRRAVLLFAVWFTGYITIYGYSAGFSVLLTGLHYIPPEAGVISAVGTLGFVVQGVFSALWSEKLQRRHWLPIGALVTVVGAVVVAASGENLLGAFAGAFLIFFGFNVWVPPTYALSAESFPTRARSTGFGLVDGVGHLGGGVGLLVIAPLVPHLNTLAALSLMSGFLVVAAIIGQFTVHTRNRPLEEVSP
jgi:MFS transporter, putative metabolite:H+ symporter